MVKKEKVTSNYIRSLKAKKVKISMLTAYDAAIASILDEAGIDIVLVGDSLGNVMLGYKNTIPVTMTEMIIHTQAVSRGVEKALVVADLPFGSYQDCDEHAVSSAIDLIKAGAQAVKLEGADNLSAIEKIIKAGIPVMGHLGFKPQSVNLSGYKYEGNDLKSTQKLLKDAKKLEKTGCFAIVLEMVNSKTSKVIQRSTKIPVIGIGSGQDCDGQVLVSYDMLGIYKSAPPFVKKYADIGQEIKKAVLKYIKDVKSSKC